MNNYCAMFETTATYLIGAPTRVRFQNPPMKGARGECYKLESGLICIDLAPHLSGELLFGVALHEIAHGVLHVRNAEPTPEHKTKSGVIPRNSDYGIFTDYMHKVSARQESDAWNLANRWNYWAHEIAAPVLKGRNEFSLCLLAYLTALKYYPIGEIKK